MHVACARGVPVVAVFCATTPALGYGPYGGRADGRRGRPRVPAVRAHGGRRCPRGTEDCMRLVAPAAVVAAARACARRSLAGGDE
jgi:heptosyltransferase-2